MVLYGQLPLRSMVKVDVLGSAGRRNTPKLIFICIIVSLIDLSDWGKILFSLTSRALGFDLSLTPGLSLMRHDKLIPSIPLPSPRGGGPPPPPTPTQPNTKTKTKKIK